MSRFGDIFRKHYQEFSSQFICHFQKVNVLLFDGCGYGLPTWLHFALLYICRYRLINIFNHFKNTCTAESNALLPDQLRNMELYWYNTLQPLPFGVTDYRLVIYSLTVAKLSSLPVAAAPVALTALPEAKRFAFWLCAIHSRQCGWETLPT